MENDYNLKIQSILMIPSGAKHSEMHSGFMGWTKASSGFGPWLFDNRTIDKQQLRLFS